MEPVSTTSGTSTRQNLGSGLFTLTLAGSSGNLKNLFGGLLKMPRFSLLAMRFGHPETTHFTMPPVGCSAPDRTEPAGLVRTLFTAAGMFVSSLPHASFPDRKRCVFDPEIQQYTDKPESDDSAPPAARKCLYSGFDNHDVSVPYLDREPGLRGPCRSGEELL